MSRTTRDILHYFDRRKIVYVEVDTVVFESGRWRIIEGDGWRDRARNSGGFDVVDGVVVHHTAAAQGGSIASSLGYELISAEAAPIGNFTLDRDGTWYVTTGGASNTNGTGGPWLTSREVVPPDTGNSRLVAVEAMNDGLGEEWPELMLDSYVRGVAAICDWIMNETPGGPLFVSGKDVMAHFEWGNVQIPNRKNDPAGPKRYAAPGPTRWDMDKFRGDVFAALLGDPEPPPPPPPEEDEMAKAVILRASDDKPNHDPLFWWDGKQVGWIRNGANGSSTGVACGFYQLTAEGKPVENFGHEGIQRLINSGWSGGPVPEGYDPPTARQVDSAVE
jgi:hypothetical protein